MSGLDLTAYDYAIKDFYTPDVIQDSTLKEHAFLALMTKWERMGSGPKVIPVIHGHGGARSKSFTKAKAKSTSSSHKGAKFSISATRDYALATIDNLTLEGCKEDVHAFMDAMTPEVDAALGRLSSSLGRGVWVDESAWMAQVSATPSNGASTFELQLKNIDDIMKFDLEQDLVIWSAKTGGTQRISETGVNTWEVLGVDRSNGKLLLDGAHTANSTIDADDYIFIDGDRGAGMLGFESWVPTTTPTTGDSHAGVDRSVDPTRLAGHRIAGANKPIEELLIDMDTQICRAGKRFSHFFLSHTRNGNFKKSLQTRVQYVDLQVTPRVGFRGVIFDGTKGPVIVVPDHNIMSNVVAGVNMANWKLCSVGKMVKLIDSDNQSSLRQSDEDGVEFRWRSYPQVECNDPSSQMVADCDATSIS